MIAISTAVSYFSLLLYAQLLVAIDFYSLSTASFYSYLTLTYLLKNRALLKGHDVDVE